MKRGQFNKGKRWGRMDVMELRKLIGQGFPSDVIAKTLGRSEASILSKSINEGLYLRPAKKPSKK